LRHSIEWIEWDDGRTTLCAAAGGALHAAGKRAELATPTMSGPYPDAASRFVH
jgi:hypothetical protein